MSQISCICTHHSIYDRILYKSRGTQPHDPQKGSGETQCKKHGATGMWVALIRSLDLKFIENSDTFDIYSVL